MPALKILPHYQATLRRLWELSRPGIRLDLEAMRRVNAALGNPCASFQSILVAGTNGKGSTAAMLSEILAAAGYKTGLYTSPHLTSYRERVVMKDINGALPFDEAAWRRGFAEVESAIASSGASLTQFEILTALCFCVFRESKPDIAVLEVGLGGRLDATNVADPVLSLICAIDYDHKEYLGHTLESIAREKAGILRRDAICLALNQAENVTDVFRAEAARIGAALELVSPGEALSLSLAGQEFAIGGERFTCGLPGAHQAANGALAIAGAKALRARGFGISDEAIRAGIARTRWPARCEVLSRAPAVLVDGAHNPHGARALAGALAGLKLDSPRRIVFGALEGKDVPGILEALSGSADEWIFCRSADPRAIAPDRLAELAGAHLPREARLHASGSAAQACRLALSRLREAGGSLVVAGSLTVAGEARRVLKRVLP